MIAHVANARESLLSLNSKLLHCILHFTRAPPPSPLYTPPMSTHEYLRTNDDAIISIEELCDLMGISVEDIYNMDTSDLPESTQTEFSNEPSSKEAELMQPDPNFNEARVVDVVVEGGIMLSSLSEDGLIFADGGCVPFVVQKIIQPRGAPNRGKVKALLCEAMENTEIDMINCRKKRKTAYESYCDAEGKISTDLLGNHKLEKYSHPVVYHALKMSGKIMRKVKSHKVLNILMPCSTVLIYGSLNMNFSCDQFPGFLNAEQVQLENDHAILVHHGRIKCVNLVGDNTKPITLGVKKHLVIMDQGKTTTDSYLASIRTAYIIE